MTGSITRCRHGEREAARDHVVVENRHEPDTIRSEDLSRQPLQARLNSQRAYGELFDLFTDMEVDNLWPQPSAQELKARLIRNLLFAERARSRSRCRALPEPEGASATSRIDRRHRGRGFPAEASLNSPHRKSAAPQFPLFELHASIGDAR